MNSRLLMSGLAGAAINYIAWLQSPALEIVCQKLGNRGWSLGVDMDTCI